MVCPRTSCPHPIRSLQQGCSAWRDSSAGAQSVWVKGPEYWPFSQSLWPLRGLQNFLIPPPSSARQGPFLKRGLYFVYVHLCTKPGVYYGVGLITGCEPHPT